MLSTAIDCADVNAVVAALGGGNTGAAVAVAVAVALQPYHATQTLTERLGEATRERLERYERRRRRRRWRG